MQKALHSFLERLILSNAFGFIWRVMHVLVWHAALSLSTSLSRPFQVLFLQINFYLGLCIWYCFWFWQFNVIFNIVIMPEVWLATKPGSTRNLKCPVPSQEYFSCYRIVRFYVFCIVVFCCTSVFLLFRCFPRFYFLTLIVFSLIDLWLLNSDILL